jgi:DNA-binding NarL/FixJ family response regulator
MTMPDKDFKDHDQRHMAMHRRDAEHLTRLASLSVRSSALPEVRKVMPIRIVLADDHPIVLTGLEQLLALEENLMVLARCINGEEAVAAVRQHRPDILLLDLQMPQKDGLAVLRELQSEDIPTRVVMLTASLQDRELLEAIRLGARGVILKETAPDVMVQGVRTVHAGGQWLEPASVSRALDKLFDGEA